MADFATGWWIEDIAVPRMTPWEWRLSRGVEPWRARFQIHVSQADAFKALENPVSLRVVAPGSDGREEVVFKRLYITSVRHSSHGMIAVEIADVRWALARVGLTHAYNVESGFGGFRSGTVAVFIPASGTKPEVATPWTARDAIEDALKRIGADVIFDETSHVDDTTVLPSNLGNVPSGGWVNAHLRQFAPAMLESIRADIVPDRDGNLRVVNRVAETVNKEIMETWIKFDPLPSVEFVDWAKPRAIRIQRQKRVERVFQLFSANDSVVKDELRQPIENVVQKLPANASDPMLDAIGKYESLGIGLASALFPAGVLQFIKLHEIPERFLQPAMIDLGGLAGGRVVLAQLAESIIRSDWRKLFRVIDLADMRSWSDVKFGRLQSDGTSKRGGVVMNFVRMSRTAVGTLKNRSDGTLTADLSLNVNENIRDPLAESNTQAPFDVQWEALGQGIFRLMPAPVSWSIVDVYPGTLFEPVRIGAKGAFGDHIETVFEHVAEFDPDLVLAVFWNALDARGEIENVHSDIIDLFPANGGIRLLDVFDSSMTANFGIVPGETGKTPKHQMLNLGDVIVRDDAIAATIKASYESTRAGNLRVSGVTPFADGVEVGGDLHEMAVLLGSGAPWEVSSTLTFASARQAPWPRGVTPVSTRLA